MSDETHKLRADYANLQITFAKITAERDAAIAERDKLRKALERVLTFGGDYTTGEGHSECRQIARAALTKGATP